MSAGFGFSAGDFVAALKVVGTVIDALRDARCAGREFGELAQLLATLKFSLVSVKEIVLEQPYRSHGLLLDRAATQCQLSIEAFWFRIRKYQPHLQSVEHNSKLKKSWMKIKWALCKREDVSSFKSDIQSHVVAIQLLLSTLQLKRQEQLTTTTGQISDISRECGGQLAHLINLDDRRTNCLLEWGALLTSTLEECQRRLSTIPAQIERQQPVYLRDALDKDSPFHLEFIRSAEALQCVLRLNLTHVRSGQEKVDQGEFSIIERGTNKEIDLSERWETCFFPGQRVGMSMLFYLPACPASACPSCGESQPQSPTNDTRCSSCGTTWQRLEIRPNDLRTRRACRRLIERTCQQENGTNEGIDPFRRIRVVHVVPDKSPVSILGSGAKTLSQSFNHEESQMTVQSSHRKSKGCLQIIERQALCLCITHEHAIDHSMPCTCQGDDHRVVVKEVFVAYPCRQHPAGGTEAQSVPTDSAVSKTPNLGEEKEWIGNLPTPPSLPSEKSAQVLPRIASDARRAVAELDTPPESPEVTAQAGPDNPALSALTALDSLSTDLADNGIEIGMTDRTIDKATFPGMVLPPEDGEMEVRTYLPATRPVAIPIRTARFGLEEEQDGSNGSWNSSFY